MNIFWICNIIFPEIQKNMGIKTGYGGGWMSSLAKSLKNRKDINLFVISPYNGETFEEFVVDKITYYVIPKKRLVEECYKIFNKIKVDLIHIHGTESGNGNIIYNAFPEYKYVVSIQGLVSVIAEHYFAGLPKDVISKKTFRDLIKNTSIKRERELFLRKGEDERDLIKKVKNVIGRTTWDRACCYEINPKVNYHFCGESLRDSFYKNKWNIDKCEKYSLFVSQGYYPIKGLHMVIKALSIVVKTFPDAHLYVGGIDITKNDKVKHKIRISYYGKYINKLIKSYNLSNNITFMGPLDEEKMCSRYLKSHVFVSGSSIENSPNSLGEAMILGVPSVSSDVGGVQDIMRNKIDGFTYPFDEYYMLAYYIMEIFSNTSLANKFSTNSQIQGNKVFNKKENEIELINIYKKIVDSDDKENTTKLEVKTNERR